LKSLRSFAILALFFCSYLTILGQDNVVKTDIIRPIRGLVGIAYERKIDKIFTIQLAFDAGTYREGSVYFHNDYQLKGFSILPEFRVYPMTKKSAAPLGVFGGLAFRYAFMDETMVDPFTSVEFANSGHIYNYGFELGYKYAIQKFIVEVLGGFGGGQMRNFKPMPYQLWQYQDIRKDELEFYRLELSLGYIF
jgi:hypothetical protein